MADLFVGLHPELVARIKQLFARMEAVKHPMKVCQGFRTAEQQHALYLIGRDPVAHPGKPITNCDGYKILSNHQSGRAADCCFQGPDPFGPHQPYATYGAVAESLGLKWGGHFALVDLDHVELPKSLAP